MIRALIIDDEASGCDVLENLIAMEHPDVEIVGSVNSIAEAVEAIEEHLPDLVFLDIKLNGHSGFEVLEKTANIDFQVIFVTAYSEYALKAIKASALDYLLKPVSRKELHSAISKVRIRLTETSNSREVERPMPGKATFLKIEKIALSSKEGYELCPVDNLLYLIADRNYTSVHLKEGSSKMTTKTLGSYEDHLSNFGFFRIHKSFIVNINEIVLYSPGNGGYVKMSDGKRFEVSRRRKKELLLHINLEAEQ